MMMMTVVVAMVMMMMLIMLDVVHDGNIGRDNGGNDDVWLYCCC